MQIDIDPHMIGLRYPFEVNLVGDAAATLQRLLPLPAAQGATARWRETVEKNVARWWEVMERRAAVDADPINPEYVVARAGSRGCRTTPCSPPTPAPPPTGTPGTCGSAAAMRGSLSGTLATMGCGVPYAIGAKFAHPDRPAIALVGDGAMQMNGMAELITAAKYWRDVGGPAAGRRPCCNNDDLNQVTWEMRAMEGAPQFLPSQQLPDVAVRGVRPLHRPGRRSAVEEPERRRGGLGRRRWPRDRPCVIEFRTDPAVPPIPPHATLDQIEAAAASSLHGRQRPRRTWSSRASRRRCRSCCPGRRHRADR